VENDKELQDLWQAGLSPEQRRRVRSELEAPPPSPPPALLYKLRRIPAEAAQPKSRREFFGAAPRYALASLAVIAVLVLSYSYQSGVFGGAGGMTRKEAVQVENFLSSLADSNPELDDVFDDDVSLLGDLG
jgi:hypothetical protein